MLAFVAAPDEPVPVPADAPTAPLRFGGLLSARGGEAPQLLEVRMGMIDGDTALGLAMSRGHAAIVRLLEGASVGRS